MPAKPAMTSALYEGLLRLYPRAYRQQFEDEMIAVFREADGDVHQMGSLGKARFYFRELGGLCRGALAEHARRIFGGHVPFPLSSRRFTMRSSFRFPKATAFLMTVILAGIVLAIEKAEAICASLPEVNPRLPPIQPAHFTFFPTVALMFLVVYIAGVAGWAILFALHRSGVHRLSEIAETLSQK